MQTSDGYNVSVDITILYRVSDPYKVVTKVGFSQGLIVAEDKAKIILGKGRLFSE